MNILLSPQKITYYFNGSYIISQHFAGKKLKEDRAGLNQNLSPPKPYLSQLKVTEKVELIQ